MKRIVAMILSVALLLCLSTVIAGNAGTSRDPLISKSYVDGEYTQQMLEKGSQKIDSTLGKVYDDAVKKIPQDNTSAPSGYEFAPRYTTVTLDQDSKAYLAPGASFVLNKGSAVINVTRGTVINVSTGEQVANGASLTANSRYFCTENTEAYVTAAAAVTGYVDGYYSTESGEVTVELPFTDVSENDWFYDAVEFTYSEGLMNGSSDTTFNPYGSTNRAMVVAILYRMAGSPSVSGSAGFSDVSSGDYFYNAVKWANKNGIVKGFDDGTFRPYDKITREQMATFISRYATLLGHDVSAASADKFNSFPDKGQVSSYAVAPMKWVTANGIINGSDGKILPYGTANRAQTAQILYNFNVNIMQ